MRYGVFSALGAVALLVLTLALPAQLADADTQSVAAPAYEALRDGTATALRIHETDAEGVSRAAFLDTVEVGDLFEWYEADDCFVRYAVTELLPDPSGTPRRLLGVEWMTYAFTGCSGAVSVNAAAAVDWGELPDLGGASLTAPVVHGIYQLLPAGWTGTVEAHEQRSHVPTDYPVYEGPSWIANPTLAQAQALPHWRTPTLPAGWTLGRISYETVDDPPFGYTADYLTPDGWSGVTINGYYKANRRWGAWSSDGRGEVTETRTIAGLPARVRYSPPGPNHSPTYPIRVWVFDPATDVEYAVQGSTSSLSGANVEDVIAIARSLFESPNPQ